MIKFFRKIRQKLISQNRFSKYLLYAVGEIVLVMIGILLALQVNNWNEQQKVKLHELNILNKLNEDLKANLLEVESIKRVTVKRIKSTKMILNYLEEHKDVDDSLKYCFERINIDDIFNNSNTTYEYIQNQGINVLTNDIILSKITSIYERDFENITRREVANEILLENDLRPLMDIYLDVSEPILLQVFGNEYSLNKPINIDALSKNIQFKNVLVRIQNYMLMRLSWQNITLAKLEELIEEVQIEISIMTE